MSSSVIYKIAKIIENRRRKFCSAFNDVLLNGGYMWEECLMEILVKQCIPVLTYGVGIRGVKEVERRTGVCFTRLLGVNLDFTILNQLSIYYFVFMCCQLIYV